MSHRHINDFSPGGLIVLKGEDLRLIPAPAVCYERYANCASLEEPPCSHLIHVLQPRPKTSSHSLCGQAGRSKCYRTVKHYRSGTKADSARDRYQGGKQESDIVPVASISAKSQVRQTLVKPAT